MKYYLQKMENNGTWIRTGTVLNGKQKLKDYINLSCSQEEKDDNLLWRVGAVWATKDRKTFRFTDSNGLEIKKL